MPKCVLRAENNNISLGDTKKGCTQRRDNLKHTKDFLGRKGFREPERHEEQHVPDGFPRARESKSQDQQYRAHPHGDNKGVKMRMNEKTGRREG